MANKSASKANMCDISQHVKATQCQVKLPLYKLILANSQKMPMANLIIKENC